MSDPRRSSRERLQDAAKRLFTERGYEATTVAAVVQLAKTSYSQFIAHFGDKNGILSAILLEGWNELNSAIRLAIARTIAPQDRLKLAVDIFLSYLEREPAFRALLLLERPTTRVNEKIQVNAGFAEFVKLLDEILESMASRGELGANLAPALLRSALFGALEGMLRDQLLAGQGRATAAYSETDIRKTFFYFISSSLQSSRVVPTAEVPVPEGEAQEQLEGSWVHHYLELAAVVLGPPGQA